MLGNQTGGQDKMKKIKFKLDNLKSPYIDTQLDKIRKLIGNFGIVKIKQTNRGNIKIWVAPIKEE